MLLSEKARRTRENKLAAYKPYAKQMEFHAAGAVFQERLLSAGNQLGKTFSGASEIAMHLTGRYPVWWCGRRFFHPVRALAGSESAELTTKGVQRLLIGTPEDESQWGTGAIPKALIVKIKKKPGVPNAIASVTVRHEPTGGNSVLKFLSYDQGRTKWQADTVDLVWFDEEPPYDVYNEGITRTNATRGICMLTFTPLKGMSDTVERFYPVPLFAGCHMTLMTIYDVGHYTKAEADAIVAKYPAHERDARTKGIPMLGEGRIFAIEDEKVLCDAFTIPDLWPRICGLDFGWTHPAAQVWVAWDRDTDTKYVYYALRMSETTPKDQAPGIKGQGDWIPVAWPHDGLAHDKGSGIQLAEQYRSEGINMLWEHAQLPEMGVDDENRISRTSVEAGLLMMLNDMTTGKFKVFRGLEQWMTEFRMYHRKDGKVVKLRDDLMAATRYAYVMLRHAICPPDPEPKLTRRKQYDWRAG